MVAKDGNDSLFLEGALQADEGPAPGGGPGENVNPPPPFKDDADEIGIRMCILIFYEEIRIGINFRETFDLIKELGGVGTLKA